MPRAPFLSKQLAFASSCFYARIFPRIDAFPVPFFRCLIV